jgi:hypothetical protein
MQGALYRLFQMNRNVNRTLCVVLAVQFGSVTGKAAAFAHIEGCVKDWQGAVVPAPYTVVLRGPGHNTKVTVDNRGKFWASVRPGLYRVTMTGWNILPYERAPILAGPGERILL